MRRLGRPRARWAAAGARTSSTEAATDAKEKVYYVVMVVRSTVSEAIS